MYLVFRSLLAFLIEAANPRLRTYRTSMDAPISYHLFRPFCDCVTVRRMPVAARKGDLTGQKQGFLKSAGLRPHLPPQ